MALAAWAAIPSTAAAVAPGFDLFETDPAQTQFTFKDEFTIPAGFFDQGSAPFTGVVHFGGVPLGSFQGRDVGDADTVVHRPQGANLVPPFPAQDTIPIELVQLSLQSVQPIQVQVGTATQRWDVRAGLSDASQSKGQMRITKVSDQGGTFDSQLLVLPKITFTRVSDGATRTIDTGQLPVDHPTFFQDLLLQSTAVPWRAGCVPPALDVPGLNTGFCPGLTVQGFKQPNLEQSRLAEHGVVPAQPRLEHFKCYAIKPQTPFKRRRVALIDQFGAGRATVVRPTDLCAPARKNNEPLVNRTAHLKCYAIAEGGFRRRAVAVRNQFGSDVLGVVRPSSLCVPSLKTPVSRHPRPPTSAARRSLTDHYACYAVTGGHKAQPPVKLVDQFGTERVAVLQAVSLCAPTQKNSVRVQHAVRHLVCYAIRDRRTFRPRAVRVLNQFGVEIVTVVKPRTLCVPSVKLPL